MKNYIFLLCFAFFATTMSAQVLPSAKKLTKKTEQAISKEKTNMDDQISKALMKDEDLQKETIDFLKSNPDTKSSLMGLLTKNKGMKGNLMKSILGNQDLASAAIGFIKSNPDLLKKAMQIVGL